MAYFAEINSSNIVIDIKVTPDDVDQTWCQNHFNSSNTWIQYWRLAPGTHDSSKRYNQADIGGTYDPARDAFIPSPAYPSLIFNESTCASDFPGAIPVHGNYTGLPDDSIGYSWDEENQRWLGKYYLPEDTDGTQYRSFVWDPTNLVWNEV